MTLEKWKFLRLFFLKIYEVTGIGIDDSLILKIFLQRIGGGKPMVLWFRNIKKTREPMIISFKQNSKEPPNNTTSPYHKSIANFYSIGHATLVTMSKQANK
jgi:hypothetical protein